MTTIWRSSHHLETQKAGDAREGSDTPGRREPKECERGRAEVLGTFSARAHRERKVQYGVCVCGRHALRAGRQLASAYRDVSQRPTQKKDMTRDSCCTPHSHHILCSAHTYTRATARRDSFIHSFIQRAYVRHAQHEAQHALVPTPVCVAAVSQTLSVDRRLGQVVSLAFLRRPSYIFVTVWRLHLLSLFLRLGFWRSVSRRHGHP